MVLFFDCERGSGRAEAIMLSGDDRGSGRIKTIISLDDRGSGRLA